MNEGRFAKDCNPVGSRIGSTVRLGKKQSVVVPLSKTLNPSSVSDFRPISIFPVISKRVEKAFAEQLVFYEYLESEGLLPETQSRFKQSFKVAYISGEEIEVKARRNKVEYISGEEIEVKARRRYYYGDCVETWKWSGKVAYISGEEIEVKARRRYHYGDCVETWEWSGVRGVNV
ncbi:hypothetical protein J6590_029281 [Homalodisca vitripennis]|nr:hypothetical protein J6590_029281 [Homalodisca vitripennis]